MTLTKEQRVEIERWIAILESGKYQQDRHQLKSCIGFCCLGVYADTHDVVWQSSDDGVDDVPFSSDGRQLGDVNASYLDGEWFEERTGIDKPGQHVLAHINDGSSSFGPVVAALRGFLETGTWPEIDLHAVMT